MKLEQQCCSLDLAKRLKELGLKQESLWKWYQSKDGKENILSNGGNLPNEYLYDFEEVASAFTVAELGTLIPGNINGDIFVTQKGMLGNLWYCTQETHNLDGDGLLTEHKEEAETEADARAKMLIYLLETGLLGS